ncbi:MAG: glycosyltransferase family 2 protein [Cyanobacteria bacterium P01_A01_bin.45]
MFLGHLVIFIAGIFLFLGAFITFVLCSLLLLECIAALLQFDIKIARQARTSTKVTVLVPAHNEELLIEETVKSIIAGLQPQDDIVVIADNCNDNTLNIAKKMGVGVIERYDSQSKGKGYALDYGLKYLDSSPPDIVIFIDADTKVEEDAIEQITQMAIATGRPVQANYLMAKHPQSTPKDLISAFAFKVKNLVRSKGLNYFGVPCILAGTGMAFPWKVIKSVDLASGSIVEDMKLGIDLVLAGHEPIICPKATVFGYLPSEQKTAKSQRTRWEHGHLQTLLTYTPQLLRASWQQKRPKLLISAMDLSIPPLSLLVVIWLALTPVAFLWGIWGISWLSATVLSAAGLSLLTAIGIAWAGFARKDIPFLELLAIPIYILWKIPVYLRFLFQPQKTWERTRR